MNQAIKLLLLSAILVLLAVCYRQVAGSQCARRSDCQSARPSQVGQ